MASDSQAGGGGALLDRGGQPFDGAGSLPGVPAAGPIAAATFEPGDATSCFASHASLAASSLESAAHAYSVPSLHISAIEISSEPYAGASSAAAAAAAFGAFEGACSCLESRTALPASEGGDAGSGVGGGGGVDKALPAAAGAADRGAAPCSTSESNAAASCFASHVSTFFLFSSVASAALSFVCSSSSRVTLPPPFASPFSARSPCFISP